MKHSKTRYIAAGLVTALAIATALVAGFVPADAHSQASAAVGGLAEAAPTVKLASERPMTVARTAVRTRTETVVTPASATGSTKASRSTGYKASVAPTGELAKARSILAGLIAQHPILKGTTVTIGTTPGGYQAVAYYKSGRIVISSKHTASLSVILNHEIWHIIDWRDNGRIDWGENIPPR